MEIKTVLVVDDEKMVEEVIQAFLERQGCGHVSYNASADALTFFEENRESIDLAIVDLTLPGINGLELAEMMTELSPGLPVILMTGLDLVPDRVVRQSGIRRVLYKPITKSELLEAVESLIGACRMVGNA
jgi:two-component system, cell cycle sensor histidine kinase and response regulator CckA